MIDEEKSVPSKFSFLGDAGVFLWELLKVVVLSVAIIVPIRVFLIQPFYVQGASMYPNFVQHDYLLIDEISYGLRNPWSGGRILGGRSPQRGEIIVFVCAFQQCGSSKGDFLIKRVIGLPGETVDIHDGHVYITRPGSKASVELVEPYLPPTTGIFGAVPKNWKLQDDQLFVLGDNRDISYDSEDFGPIPRVTVVGRVWIRGWPFDRLQEFPPPKYQGL